MINDKWERKKKILGLLRIKNNEIYVDMMIKFYVCFKEIVVDVVIYILFCLYIVLLENWNRLWVLVEWKF